jgi:hypothetical protein
MCNCGKGWYESGEAISPPYRHPMNPPHFESTESFSKQNIRNGSKDYSQ